MTQLRSASLVAATLAALLVLAAPLHAQQPWQLTIRPATTTLMAGNCTPVYLDIKVSGRGETPRNPVGTPISLADFDMSVGGGAIVGRYDGASAWSACPCLAAAGASATITATYPAKSLAEKSRVAGVAFQQSLTVPVVAGGSRGVPVGCDVIKTTTVASGGTAPWAVTLRSTVTSIPIGTCSAVLIDLRDATGKESPRNPAGTLISLADFDMAATAGGGAVAGAYSGPTNWSACACQAGAVGTIATITASYPGRGLTEAARVPGVAFQASIQMPLGKAPGTTDPPACLSARTVATAPAPIPVAGTPGRTAPVQQVPAPQPIAAEPLVTKTAVAPPAPGPAPAGMSVTGTPATATLKWLTVPGVASYAVTREPAPVPATPVLLAAANLGMFDNTLQPNTAYTWTVRAIQADGREGSAKVTFTTPPAVNPAGFVAKLTGSGQVELSWLPVDGAPGYGVFGPGTAGGKRVTDTTRIVLTGIPLGEQEWSLGTFYEGNASTPLSEFPKAKLKVTLLELTGWVDLHTHPMVHLGFGGNLIHGGVDVGSLLPSDISCVGGGRATSIAHALSDDRPSHGGWNLLEFPCGDELRKLLHHEFQSGNHALTTASPANGYPDFDQWPKWNDITHQKMWFEWIRLARDGGLRVMVALATNNKTLADAMTGGSLVSGSLAAPTDDKGSADLQLAEMEAFVKRHPDFMEIAYGSADIKRIVQSNRIAVVLGVEVDNLGNFNTVPVENLPAAAAQLLISDEIQRLYNAGARYIFPVHVLDNKFGGTAIYEGGFNTSNRREAGYYWSVECADVADNITHQYKLGEDILENVLKSTVAMVKLGIDPFMMPGPPPVCPGNQSGKSSGHRNARGLTPAGAIAIREMMKRGMIIDIDHMSQKTAEATLTIAETYGYPVVSGHTGMRGSGGSNAENSRNTAQMERISRLHGMFGLGSDGAHAHTWAGLYQSAMLKMGYLSTDPARANYEVGAVSFGTDLNGLVKGPKPGGGGANQVVYTSQFPISTTGNRSWNYNTDGVAHYGMLRDFVEHLRSAPPLNYTSGGIALGVAGKDLVDRHLNRSANYFWLMWERIESRKGAVP